MKAYREDMPFGDERRGLLTLALAVAGVLVLGALLYFGLSASEEPAAAAAAPIVRDSATVVPPVVDSAAPTAAAQQTPVASSTERGDLTERPLAAPRTTIGAGAAPATTRDSADSVVINGKLLEDIEAEAAQQ